MSRAAKNQFFLAIHEHFALSARVTGFLATIDKEARESNHRLILSRTLDLIDERIRLEHLEG